MDNPVIGMLYQGVQNVFDLPVAIFRSWDLALLDPCRYSLSEPSERQAEVRWRHTQLLPALYQHTRLQLDVDEATHRSFKN